MAQPVRMRATVGEITRYTERLAVFELIPEREVPRFRPGQFLHIALDSYEPSRNWPESRTFSIASPPEVRDRVRITVSAVGQFTQWLMSLETGNQVWIKLPYGEFVVHGMPGRSVVLVAGGTGIAPFASYLLSLEIPDNPVRLLYGVRGREHLVHLDAVCWATDNWPNFVSSIYLEHGEFENSLRGRPSVEACLLAAKGCGNLAAEYYLSGPPAMLETLKGGLVDAGVGRGDIHTDAWN